VSSYPETEEPCVANQNVPKDGLREPYSGQPIHLAAATGAGASYRVAAVGCWWTASGVRGVELALALEFIRLVCHLVRFARPLCSFRVDEVVQRGYSGLVVDLVTPGGLLPAGSRDHSFA
jgi:hypothetical protein